LKHPGDDDNSGAVLWEGINVGDLKGKGGGGPNRGKRTVMVDWYNRK